MIHNTMYCSFKNTKNTRNSFIFVEQSHKPFLGHCSFHPKKKNANLILIVAYFCDLSHSASPWGIIPLETRQNKPSQINQITSIGVGLYL